MSLSQLEAISWHDLPVKSLIISEAGVGLVVTPFEETEGRYIELQLSLTSIEGLQVEIAGHVSGADLTNLEVATFEFADLGSGFISGRVGLIPGSAGYWRIVFTKAKWEFGTTNRH